MGPIAVARTMAISLVVSIAGITAVVAIAGATISIAVVTTSGTSSLAGLHPFATTVTASKRVDSVFHYLTPCFANAAAHTFYWWGC